MRFRLGLALSVLAGVVCAAGAQGVPQTADAQSAAGATAKRPMTFADLMAMKRVSDPQISPSGKWVLFSVTDVSLEKNTKVNHLWVVPMAGGGVEWQVSDGTGESNGRFSPDGKWVMYSSSKKGGAQIWVARWDETTGTLGFGHPVTTLETGADGTIWAPDSKHFLFTSDVYPECESHAAMGAQRNQEEANCNAQKDAIAEQDPVKALVFTHLLYRHWDHYLGEKRSHIFYASVDGGAPEDLTPASVIGDHVAPTFSLGGPLGYAISPDGREVAYVVNLDKVPAESTNNDIYTVQVGAEPSTAKKVSTSPGSDDGPAYSPDGKWLAWRSQARAGFESDLFRLVVMDRASGAIRDVLPKWDNWVDEFAWAPNSEAIYFASGVAGEEPVFRVILSDGSITESLDRGEHSDLRPTSGTMGIALLAARMRVDAPSEIVEIPSNVFGKVDDVVRHARFGPGDGEVSAGVTGMISAVVALNKPLLSQLDFSKTESFWFTGAANTQVEGFIIRPPNFDPAKKYPVKFLMHGGPQTAWGDAWSYRWNPELFAANGYVVVMINRRGSTGYGQKFVDEVSGDWGGKAYVDLMKGLDYAETKYPFIDKDRECALGASYGGFMANWVLTHTDRFKCIVTHDGMYNPQSAFGTTEELWFNEWEFRPVVGVSEKRNGREKNNGDGAAGMVEQTRPAYPWDYFDKTNDEDPFRKWSPMLHIKNAHTPTLIIHSQHDYRLDVSEGFQLFTALQLLGVPSKTLYFPDESHWVLKPRNSQFWNETVNDWCDRWTGTNAYAEIGPEKNPVAVKQNSGARDR